MLGSYAKREKPFLSSKTTLARKIRRTLLSSQEWYNWIVVTRKKNKHLSLSCSQITNLSLILQAHHHNMNQFPNDLSKQSSGSLLVKEIEVPKHVGDMLKSWLNKAKKARDVRNNITIVEPYGGTSDTKNIMITNLNP
ncbi:unnamed protein product [Vicia faba]|uniref:Uncharacterized protein n=1 Tax=Vicia faba TaxID=3906 RepID=A0AAV1ATX3_VICFA|nr:unnamed protein product [Vicia faba]